jgi:hexosaminidase
MAGVFALACGLVAASVYGQAVNAGAAAGNTLTLMPVPAQMSVNDSRLTLTPAFTAATGKFHDDRLDAAVSRALARLENLTGLQIATAPVANGAGTLTISVDGPGEAIQSDNEVESYSLEVTANGAQLKAATDVGAIHGLETFLQLVQSDDRGYFLPGVSIEDTPRFKWRGLLIDCSRHFEPIDVILRTLDGMAAVKMNVFHWHLTDDEGFRIESRIFPELTGKGSGGLYYTQEQAREVVAYARARGIRVVPEFDIPGHAQSWYAGYPDLASGPGPYPLSGDYGIIDAAMDPTRGGTYKFLDKFFGEMAQIFPDPYMHIGGDENNGVQWKSNPQIQAFMVAHHLTGTAGLQTYFNQKLLPILKKHGKRMIGWDEIYAPGLPKDTVIQSWRGFDSLAASAKDGYSGILSAGYYLDHMDPAGEHYLVDPLPANSDLTSEQKARILGGEVCMWGEHVTPLSIDSRIWPRTAAMAERLWSPQDVRDVPDMYRRLWVESVRLEAFGLTHISHEDVALRQLTGTQAIAPLRVLASVVQPVGFDQRWEMQRTTQLTPMDHLIDAVRPDPPSRYEFEMRVQSYLKDHNAAAHDELAGMFESWVRAAPHAQALMEESPRLRDAAVRAQQMGEMGAAGLAALDAIGKGTPAPQGWKQSQLDAMDTAEKMPAGLVRFVVIGPLRDLVSAVQ